MGNYCFLFNGIFIITIITIIILIYFFLNLIIFSYFREVFPTLLVPLITASLPLYLFLIGIYADTG